MEGLHPAADWLQLPAHWLHPVVNEFNLHPDEASPLADEGRPLAEKHVHRQLKPVPPAGEAPSVGPYFFFWLLFFLNCMLIISKESNTIRISINKCLF